MHTSPTVILASGSPRRQELLALLGVPFESHPTDAEEHRTEPPAEIGAALPPCPVPLHDHPVLRAWRKAAACAQVHESVIIGADTIVVLDGAVLNKPHDADDARAMLAQLAGRVHTVYTGMCVLAPGQPPALRLCASDVTIAALTPEIIAGYVATGEPLDKAGAYGIQGLGGQLVERVVGSFTNVVGLPLPVIADLLRAAGVAPTVEPDVAYARWLRHQRKEPPPWPTTSP